MRNFEGKTLRNILELFCECAVGRTGRTTLLMGGLATALITAAHAQYVTWLGTLGGRNSHAHGVSADGSVVVGVARDVSGQRRAVRWVGTTIEDLNTIAIGLSPGSVLEAAYDISPNGRYIVGWGYNASTGRVEGWVMDLHRKSR